MLWRVHDWAEREGISAPNKATLKQAFRDAGQGGRLPAPDAARRQGGPAR